MVATIRHISSLATVERSLATHKVFAEPSRILEARLGLYDLMVQALADRVASVREDASILAAQPPDRRAIIMDDPVVRYVFHDAFNLLKQDNLPAEPELLRALYRALRERSMAPTPTSPLEWEMPQSIIVGRPATWVWCANSSATTFVTLFKQQFVDHCLRNTLTDQRREGALITPDARLLKLLQDGCDLLFMVLPELIMSALSHVRMIAWVRSHTADAAMQSGSARTIPGAVFLSVDHLQTPWSVAEALLHEAIHNKLFDLYLTRLVLDSRYRAASAATVLSPWNEHTTFQSNRWPLDQALAAFHVYVHLALFAAALEEREEELFDRFGPIDRTDKALTCWVAAERARYLGKELRELAREGASNARYIGLGPDGHELIQWLLAELAVLEGTSYRAPVSNTHDSLTSDSHFLYRRVPNLLIRGEDQWKYLLVYTPDKPDLHWLDERTALIFKLCEDGAFEEILSSYIQSTGDSQPHALAAAHVRNTLQMLVKDNLVDAVIYTPS